ncbi:NADase-type glycan-binding domain-containing protein [Pseudodesulfovibrio tunisiensis]|uniref:NADase-type glycan-binding domain-containing protein n=1 Tax=Pseudodesulfovibrio tunisiensis TaxID=463192 RepID=UPI001FB29F51|nr:hypothetical protein [Pseudodesulfovibrio tunisiensis]
MNTCNASVRDIPAAFLAIILILSWALPASALDVTIKVSDYKVDLLNTYSADKLMDNDTSTAWAGGGLGVGPGKWIELIFPAPVRVAEIGIFNGHEGPGRFEEFRRIKAGRIRYPDGTTHPFVLWDKPGEQRITCRAEPVEKLRIEITEVYPDEVILGKIKVAVSELKLYVAANSNAAPIKTVIAPPTEMPDATKSVEPQQTASEPSLPADVIGLLDRFYALRATLNDDLDQLFAPQVYDKYLLNFFYFQEIQRQRGLYDKLRAADVDTGELRFDLVEDQGEVLKIRASGPYYLTIDGKEWTVQEERDIEVKRQDDRWLVLKFEAPEKAQETSLP